MIIDNKFTNGWAQRGATGVFTPNGDIIRIQSPDISNPAFYDHYFPIEKNTEINVEVEARLISGSKGLIGIDTASDTAFSDAVFLDGYDVKSLDWEKIPLKLQIPVTNTKAFARLCLGVRTPDIATVEFRHIKVETKSPTLISKPELIACGLLRKTSGNNPDIHPDFASFGVYNISWNANDTITVTLNASSVGDRRPIVLITGTPDNFRIPQAGGMTAGERVSFTIKLSDGTTNAINMSTLNFYLNFMVYL